MLGGLPAATRRCVPSSVRSPSDVSTVRRIFPVSSCAAGLGPQQDLDTVLAQDLGHRYIGILSAHQLPTELYDRDLAAETPEHLGELQPDVTAAEHEQVLRQDVELHDGGRVQGRYVIQTFDRRVGRPGASVDKDVVRAELEVLVIVRAYRERFRARKAGFASDQVKSISGFDAPQVTVPEAVHHRPLAASHLGHVDGDRTVVDAVVGRTPVYVGRLRAGDHRLGGGAALVDAGAADVLAFDQGCSASRPGERLGERDPGLACPDHHGVVMLCCHIRSLLSLGACSRRALMDVCLGYPGRP